MRLSPVVESFATTVTLTRTAEGSYVEGRYVPGVSTTSELRAAVSPASPRDLQALPEGLRTEQLMQFFASVALRTAEAAGSPADRVTFGGYTYEIQHVEDWSVQAGYWRAVGVKVGQ